MATILRTQRRKGADEDEQAHAQERAEAAAAQEGHAEDEAPKYVERKAHPFNCMALSMLVRDKLLKKENSNL